MPPPGVVVALPFVPPQVEFVSVVETVTADGSVKKTFELAVQDLLSVTVTV